MMGEAVRLTVRGCDVGAIRLNGPSAVGYMGRPGQFGPKREFESFSFSIFIFSFII
jgi:hypothetical protein